MSPHILDPDLPDLVEEPRSRRGFALVAGFFGLVAFLGVVVVLVALTFSVQVSGRSMEPTLEPGDRLVTDVFGGGSKVQRFDVVGARVPDVGVVVKRVIALPGDTVQIRVEDDRPVVVVRPAGSDVDHIVDNPAWPPRVAGRARPCCGDDGRLSPQSAPVRVPAGSYWVLGDNWGGSDDSRVFGFVSAQSVGASLNLRVLPWHRFGRVDHDVRLRPAP